jgi:glutamyl-tRNA synthetase
MQGRHNSCLPQGRIELYVPSHVYFSIMATVRTRIAPSPTGEDIHIGNLYTALINFTWARKNHGQFIVRIEDTDRERYVEGAEERILGSLHAYGLDPDESIEKGGPFAPYRQSERLASYKKYAEELIEKEKAYYCFCTKERLEELRKRQLAEKKTPRYDKQCKGIKNYESRIMNGEPYVIRLDVPANKKIVFHDLIRGKIEFDSHNIDDQVLIKSDGYPTYHMAVVVDDHLMEITYVIRAEEWISSTPKHVLLYEAFGWELPMFAHLPILRNPDKSKLSKRKNPVWARWYLEQGFLPEAMLNFLALMGWSHPDGKEIFSLAEFTKLFQLIEVKPVGPVFDLVKLRWMNQQYIQNLSDDALEKRLKEFSPIADEMDESQLKKLLPLVKSRMEVLKDFDEQVKFFIESKGISPRNGSEEKVSEQLSRRLEKLSEWKKDAIMAVFKGVLQENNIRMPVLYFLLTGKEKGLPLPESIEILGKERTLQRLGT